MSGKSHPTRPESDSDAALLSRLGFGPETLLMTDPKLFVDRVFLSALLAELEEELGAVTAAAVLFQIGVTHGLRDARRSLSEHVQADGVRDLGMARSTSLAIALGPAECGVLEPGLRMTGEWPELHEAEARLQRVGPADGPRCQLSAGYTSGWLSGTTDRDLIAVETSCAGAGGDTCRFEVREPSAWQEDPRALSIPGIDLTEGLAPFRSDPVTSPEPAPQASHTQASTPTSSFDPEDKAVHIWGPVMILPFTNTNEVLATVDMLGREPGTLSIRVVVIDISDIEIDEGFMAAGLEQALEAIDGWGAEPILAGLSAFSEAAVAGLENRPLVLRKDLSEAIATAFQIADAQRHIL